MGNAVGLNMIIGLKGRPTVIIARLKTRDDHNVLRVYFPDQRGEHKHCTAANDSYPGNDSIHL
jgi:hypothetical protein